MTVNQASNRSQFFAIASQMMRRILVDHARARKAAKRPGAAISVDFGKQAPLLAGEVDILALDDALEVLAKTDPQRPRWWSCAFSGG